MEASAQSEPPTTWLLPPKDLWAFSYQYLDLESNITPSSDVVLANGVINAYVNAIPIVRSFSIGGNIAQVFVVPTFGNLTASVNINDIPGFGNIDLDPNEFEIIDKTGMMDSQVNLRVGLYNAPALNIIELSQWERKFRRRKSAIVYRYNRRIPTVFPYRRHSKGTSIAVAKIDTRQFTSRPSG